MKINKIGIRNFKTLVDVAFEPGQINILIGANGSGKTTILEAIGILSAAMTDRVDNNSLQRKGIRLSTPSLYKSCFSDLERKAATIGFDISWEMADTRYKYSVNLNTPNEKNSAKRDMWRYHSEQLFRNDSPVWGRSGASHENYDPYVGLFMLEPDSELIKVRPDIDVFRDFGIYQPNTQVLRGTQVDPYQSSPVGLCGGRLAEAIADLIVKDENEDEWFGSLAIEDVLELIDWASGVNIANPKKNTINASVPTSRRIIEFQDRYLRKETRFTAYDASEGALYVLFMLCLAMHKEAPSVFSIDGFDHAMHPRLARAVTRLFCQTVIEQNKTAFITTHSPLVLDGLNLQDDRVRLFAVNKDLSDGHTTLDRITISDGLIQSGYSLSRLWTEGRLGGVPDLL